MLSQLSLKWASEEKKRNSKAVNKKGPEKLGDNKKERAELTARVKSSNFVCFVSIMWHF